MYDRMEGFILLWSANSQCHKRSSTTIAMSVIVKQRRDQTNKEVLNVWKRADCSAILFIDQVHSRQLTIKRLYYLIDLLCDSLNFWIRIRGGRVFWQLDRNYGEDCVPSESWILLWEENPTFTKHTHLSKRVLSPSKLLKTSAQPLKVTQNECSAPQSYSLIAWPRLQN
jgi:hypothetical protein